MHALIAVQVAFCVVVVFLAGVFVSSFRRLANQPTGFSSEGLLALYTVADRPQPPVFWNQAAEHLRAQPGVESVAMSGWPLLDGNGLERIRPHRRRACEQRTRLLPRGIARVDRHHEDSTGRGPRPPPQRHVPPAPRS